VVLEAMRECLQGRLRRARLRELMSDIRAPQGQVVEVETQSASPFARSLLFRYVAMFLYDATPRWPAARATLSLDSALLAELLARRRSVS